MISGCVVNHYTVVLYIFWLGKKPDFYYYGISGISVNFFLLAWLRADDLLKTKMCFPYPFAPWFISTSILQKISLEKGRAEISQLFPIKSSLFSGDSGSSPE